MYRIVSWVTFFALLEATVAMNTGAHGYYTSEGHVIVYAYNPESNSTECSYFDSENLVGTLAEIPELYVLVEEDVYQNMVTVCQLLQFHNRRKRDTGLQFIFPGTKWCGKGDIASNYDDLGEDVATDMCCRTHDHCPDKIEDGQTAYGITNTRGYTVSSCDCDAAFRSCLQGVGSPSAQSVELFFFDILVAPCLSYDHPESCVGSWFWKKCTPDTSKPKEWMIKEKP